MFKHQPPDRVWVNFYTKPHSKTTPDSLVALEYSENLEFFTITADQHTDLSTTFNIEKIPSLIIFTDKSNDNIKKGKKIEMPTSEFMIETIENIVEEGALSLDNLQEGQSMPDNIEEIIQKQMKVMAERDSAEPVQSIDERLRLGFGV